MVIGDALIAFMAGTGTMRTCSIATTVTTAPRGRLRRRMAAAETRKMSSEYDFLSPYSRRLRRTAAYLAGMGAVVAGAVSTALIVAVPLQPRSNSDPALSAPVAGLTQNGVQPAVREDAKATTGDVSVRAAEKALLPTQGQAGSTVANTGTASLTPPGNTSSAKSALAHLKLEKSAPAASDPTAPSPRVQPPTDAAVSPARQPTGAAAQPPAARPSANRSKSERPINSTDRARDTVTPEQLRVRPEPFSIRELFATRGLQ